MSTDVSPSITLPSVAPRRGNDTDISGVAVCIVYHPDVTRVGERAFFPKQQNVINISRKAPVFQRGGQSDAGTPLQDQYVSRAPLRIELRDGQVSFSLSSGSSRVLVFDQAVGNSGVQLSQSALEQGILVFVASRVVLLLRNDTPRIEPPDDRNLLIGSSTAMTDLRKNVTQLARAGADVLIRGASGTGKELVAQALHTLGSRAAGPFVPVNMSAIPGELGAAELFGCEPGAYTGAEVARPGYFGQAEGGTLFLDEIGDTPVPLQPQLLRALQQREVQPLGGVVRHADVCLLSATDRELDAPGSNFNQPLRYRLGAVELHVPNLSERREDVGELALYFLQYYRQHLGVDTQLPDEVDDPREQAYWAFTFYRLAINPWPGNVRQLENTIRRLLLNKHHDVASLAVAENKISEPLPKPRESCTRAVDIDDRSIVDVLRDCEWEVSQAAKAMGVSRQSLYRRIESIEGLRLAHDISVDELADTLVLHKGSLNCSAKALQVSRVALERRLRELGLSWQ